MTMATPVLAVIAFVVPLPPRELRRNHGTVHFGERARAARAYRNDVRLIAQDALVRHARKGGCWPHPAALARVTIKAKVRRGSISDGLYRPRDIYNVADAFKAGFDALIDAGIVVDDDTEHMKSGAPDLEYVTNPDSEGILVTVEALQW